MERKNSLAGLSEAVAAAIKGKRFRTSFIEQHIEENPFKPGLYNARLREAGTAVWAIVAYSREPGATVESVASEFEASPESVLAALGYYRRNNRAIDSKLSAY